MKTRSPRLTACILATAALLVPRHQRARWREEWAAELDHAESVWRAQPRARLRLVRMAAGALTDATTLRVIAAGEWLCPGGIKRLVQGVGRDVRLALRGLASSPGLALGIAGSLMIGLAANTAAFSVLQTVMFRPFPHVVDQHDLVRLCVVRGHSPFLNNRPWCAASYDDYRQLRDRLDTVAGLSAYLPLNRLAIKIDDDHARTMSGALVSSNYFEVLGVTPAFGRFFTPDDESGSPQPVAIVSYRVWQRHLDGSPDALGRVMLVNGAAVRIVGVAPDTFVGVKKNAYDIGVWLPFAIGDLALRGQEGQPVSVSAYGVSIDFDFIARVRPGVSIDAVETQGSAIAAGLPQHLPSQIFRGLPPQMLHSMTVPAATPISAERVFLNDPAQWPLTILAFQGVPSIVLMIACVNAALLFIARASRRSSEWRVRLALGATRWRLVRQLLVEATVLSAAGGAAGLLLTVGLLHLQKQWIPLPVPIDTRVLLFTLSAVLGTAFVFGCGPAWAIASRATATPTMLGRFRQHSRARSILIAVQAALCVGLLTTGAQFIRSVQTNLTAVGVSDPDRVVITSFDLDKLRYSGAEIDTFYSRLVDGARTLSGVASAGLSKLDYWGTVDSEDFVGVLLPGETSEVKRTSLTSAVQGDLFGTLDMTVTRGRALTSTDATGSVWAVVVNDAFERTFLDGQAIGRALRLVPHGASPGMEVQAEVVGVVATIPGNGRVDNDARPHLYRVTFTGNTSARRLYLKTADAPAAIAHLRQLVASLDDRVPVEATTLTERLAERRMEERWMARSTDGLGLLGLILTTGGLFGVVTYVVALRTQEIGVRMALGATRENVLTLIMRQALTPVVIGLVAGSGMAVGLGLLIRSRLYGTDPLDPIAIATGAVLLIVATAAASLIPARRASRIAPNSVLRDT